MFVILKEKAKDRLPKLGLGLQIYKPNEVKSLLTPSNSMEPENVII